MRYFSSNDNYKENDVVVYDSWDGSNVISDFDWSAYETNDDENINDDNEIDVICSLEDCENLGNVRFDIHKPNISVKSDIVIARKDNFIYWERDRYEDRISYGNVHNFDIVSNSLLFLYCAKPRYPYPDEKKWLEVYTYAKNKVEELDIPQMIDELKVEYHNNS